MVYQRIVDPIETFCEDIVAVFNKYILSENSKKRDG